MVSKADFKITSSINKEKWNEFVYSNPRGNIFQTIEMAEVYSKTKRMESLRLAAVDENDNIQAVLVAYISKEKSGLLEPFASRAVILGGPIFLDTKKGINAMVQLIEYYDTITKKKAIFSEIRVIHKTPQFKLLENVGYVYEDHLNYLVDLTRPKDELWNRLSKSRRRFIRNARKKGVIVEEMKDCNTLPVFYDLLSETYKNARIPLADISLFKSAFDLLVPKNMLKIFLARYKEEYIGGIMVPLYKGTIYEWYVCGSRNHPNLYPSEVVTWHPIEWGAENGFHTFDFGGAGRPDQEYGVRYFKSQFGGKLVNFGRYRQIYSPLRMKIAMCGFKIYQKLLC